MDLLQKMIHYDADTISIYFISRKGRKVSVKSPDESNWVRHIRMSMPDLNYEDNFLPITRL